MAVPLAGFDRDYGLPTIRCGGSLIQRLLITRLAKWYPLFGRDDIGIDQVGREESTLVRRVLKIVYAVDLRKGLSNKSVTGAQVIDLVLACLEFGQALL